MLVTVSGIVGSGKTTAANRILAVLSTQGVAARHRRFQTLPCFTLLKPPNRQSSAAAHANGEFSSEANITPTGRQLRWRHYRRKRLTAIHTAGYVARIVAFRLYRLSWPATEITILNRYFYDALVHYRCSTPLQRLYCTIVRRLIPVPDLAIVLVATPQTIARRRPDYSGEYLEALDGAYRELASSIPGLVIVSTDPGEPGVDSLDALLVDRLPRGRR